MLMSDEAWNDIERHADLWLTYGDRDAFRPDHLRAVLAEVRQLRTLRTRLAALNQQYLTRLAESGATDGGLGRLGGPAGKAGPPTIEPSAIIPPTDRRL